MLASDPANLRLRTLLAHHRSVSSVESLTSALAEADPTFLSSLASLHARIVPRPDSQALPSPGPTLPPELGGPAAPIAAPEGVTSLAATVAAALATLHAGGYGAPMEERRRREKQECAKNPFDDDSDDESGNGDEDLTEAFSLLPDSPAHDDKVPIELHIVCPGLVTLAAASTATSSATSQAGCPHSHQHSASCYASAVTAAALRASRVSTSGGAVAVAAALAPVAAMLPSVRVNVRVVDNSAPADDAARNDDDDGMDMLQDVEPVASAVVESLPASKSSPQTTTGSVNVSVYRCIYSADLVDTLPSPTLVVLLSDPPLSSTGLADAADGICDNGQASQFMCACVGLSMMRCPVLMAAPSMRALVGITKLYLSIGLPLPLVDSGADASGGQPSNHNDMALRVLQAALKVGAETAAERASAEERAASSVAAGTASGNDDEAEAGDAVEPEQDDGDDAVASKAKASKEHVVSEEQAVKLEKRQKRAAAAAAAAQRAASALAAPAKAAPPKDGDSADSSRGSGSATMGMLTQAPRANEGAMTLETLRRYRKAAPSATDIASGQPSADETVTNQAEAWDETRVRAVAMHVPQEWVWKA